MSNNLKILLGVGVAVVVLLGGYIWFSSSQSEDVVVVSGADVSTSGTLGEASNTSETGREVLAKGRAILQTLTLLQSAKIDSAFLRTGTSSLDTFEDYSVAIPEAERGKINPFAPLPGFSIKEGYKSLETQQGTTSKTNAL